MKRQLKGRSLYIMSPDSRTGGRAKGATQILSAVKQRVKALPSKHVDVHAWTDEQMLSGYSCKDVSPNRYFQTTFQITL